MRPDPPVRIMADMSNDPEFEGPGLRFWLVLGGGIVAACLGGLILFSLFGLAWAAWGGFTALLVALALIIGVAWLLDRVQKQRYDDALGE